MALRRLTRLLLLLARAPSPEHQISDREAQTILWQKLKSFCKNNKEIMAVHGSFVLGLKPREVYELYANDFEDVRDVSRTKDNFLARMRRNEGISAIFAGCLKFF